MAFTLASAVEHIAKTAGWSVVTPDEQGVYHYFLEDGLNVDIRSPNGRLFVLSADLGEVPEQQTEQFNRRLKEIGKNAAGILRRRVSVISINEGRFELFLVLDMAESDEADYITAMRDFLNDEAWWRASLDSEGLNPGTQSPFSLDTLSWFPGQFKL